MFLKHLQRVFAVIALVSLCWFGWQSRTELGDLLDDAALGYLVLAVALWCITHLLAPLTPMLVFGAVGHPIHFRTAAMIHTRNLPARYVPGGIWHTVSRIVAYRDIGVNGRALSAFVLLENAVAAATAFVIGGLALILVRGPDFWGHMALLGVVAGFLMVSLLPRLLKTRLLRFNIDVPLRTYITVVSVACIYWLIAASAFAAYVSAYTPFAANTSPLESGAAYLFAWAVGFIALFAPQGIGVFEIVASELLRNTGSLTSVAALLAGFRLVVLVADAVVWALSRLLPAPDARRENAG